MEDTFIFALDNFIFHAYIGKNLGHLLLSRLLLFGHYFKESIAMGRRGQWAGNFVSGEGSKERSEYSIRTVSSWHLWSALLTM